MTSADQIRRFATLGNHLPRHCGIATFTTHLTEALSARLPGADGFVVAMNDGGHRHAYPSCVRFEIGEGDLSAYRRAADFLNVNQVDVRRFDETSQREARVENVQRLVVNGSGRTPSYRPSQIQRFKGIANDSLNAARSDSEKYRFCRTDAFRFSP